LLELHRNRERSRGSAFPRQVCVRNLLLRGPRKFARETVRIADDVRTDDANAEPAIFENKTKIKNWEIIKCAKGKFAKIQYSNIVHYVNDKSNIIVNNKKVRLLVEIM